MTVECFHSIGPHVDAVDQALDRQSVLQMYPRHVLILRHQLAVIAFMCHMCASMEKALFPPSETWEYVYTADCFVYMAIYNLEIV